MYKRQVFIVLSFVVGANAPVILGKAAWSYITFVYIFFAAVLPMWLLKQPRDYMTTFMFIGMIAGAVIGLFVAHPTMNLPVFTGFNNEKLGTMFPILFVTVACGAVSGFHSLVSSGTSSKTVENEKDMLKVGYGAMVLESLLAVLALCVAGAAAAADGTAFVFMGHGTSHTAKVSYSQMQTTMQTLGYDNVFIGTVEGEPEDTSCEAVIAAVKEAGYTTVVLRPLMVVAGDHANNDMAGADEDSWKTMFEAAGFTVNCQISGLGRIADVQALYVAHSKAAIDAIA